MKGCVEMKESEIEILERQGCFSDDWSLVDIADGTELGRIRNVYFRGKVSIGKGTEIINVPGGISGVRIGENVRIVNVARIENSPSASYGVGTDIAVLDETGTCPVRIYPGISAQVATIAARMPEYSAKRLLPMIDRHIESFPDIPDIGDGAEILDCGPIIDVRIWPYVKVEGAARLKNGSIVNNSQESRVKSQVSRVKCQESMDMGQESRALTYVGQGVNAENFIIEDASVANGVLLRNTYVGQGCVIDKGFTSHDSLFFANCFMENGEACAVLAGPFSVSMHKSSLLIGCHTSFMNAGSGTNMSNHMYKLGPLHWGVLERGTKTSSNAYIMHGSHIGAFSLVMGEHKTHPDTSHFPFSYLFGDKDGNTIVVPGAMLRSYGLKRDGEKWPKRDRRLGHGIKLHDRISFGILNPQTVSIILKAIDTIDLLLAKNYDKEGYIYHNGLKMKYSSLEKGRRIYELALSKYLHSLKENGSRKTSKEDRALAVRWIDLSGQIIPDTDFKKILDSESIADMEASLDRSVAGLWANELVWTEEMMKDFPGKSTAAQRACEFDSMVDKDHNESLSQIKAEKDLLSAL